MYLASVRFEHSVCRGSLMTTYIMRLDWLVENSWVHWYLQCVNVHHVPKWMSFHKAIVVIIRRAHCFHDYIYIMPILILWDLSTLCVVDHLYFAPCLAFWALFGSLVPAIYPSAWVSTNRKAIVIITRRAHYFMITYTYIYIYKSGIRVEMRDFVRKKKNFQLVFYVKYWDQDYFARVL